MSTPIDFSAFTAAVSDEEIAAFRKDPAPPAKATPMTPGTIGCLAIVIAILLAIVAGAVVSVVWAIASAASGNTGPAIGVGGLGLLVGGSITFVALASRGPAPREPWEQWLRLGRFARANGLRFRASDEAPSHAGMIFSLGERRAVTNRLTTADGGLDMGNFSYADPGTRGRDRHDWGYLAIRLERALPHLVLDSMTNNGVLGSSRLPGSFDRSQVLSLEGDFDTHFRLYAPTGSETDALYIFTPDLMALLIDEAAPFDVEIVDDWMFVYSPDPFTAAPGSSTHAATYWRLFRIVDTIGAKALSQTDRYVDQGAPDFGSNVVSAAARRLRQPRISLARIGSSIVTGIAVIVGVVFGAISLVVLVFATISVIAR